MTHVPQSGCLDRREAAEYLSVSTRMVDKLASAGSLPRIKLGRKTVFRISDLNAYIETRVQHLGSEA